MKGRFLCAVSFALCLCAQAADADNNGVDGSAYLSWWSNNFSADALDASFDAGTVGVEAEAWWSQRWGIKGSLFKSDVLENDSKGGPDFLSFDVKRRLISPTQNNFLALGLGWQSVDLTKDADTEGFRLLLQGALGLTPVLSVFGHAAWLPGLVESDQLKDPKGLEFEAGIAVNPFPYLSLRAGYRQFNLDFNSPAGENETSRSKGVVLGAGVTF
jgi:opacity protein-like surface antigen